MANKPIRKEVVEQFIEQILKDAQTQYDNNCNLPNLVYYLIKRGLIPTERARNYAIVRDYQRYVTDTAGTKTDFCFVMEEKYKIREKQIYNILSKYLPKFFLEKHIDYTK